MGLGLVLLFWAFVGTVAAGIGGVVFSSSAGFLTRHVKKSRRRVLRVAGLFPLACLIWAGGIFVFSAVVNEGFLHRDLGLGDSWHCPLPNGYQILLIDVTDQGMVYNTKTQGNDGAVTEHDDAIDGVRFLQVAGPFLFATSDSKAFDHMNQSTEQVDSYFALDTRTGHKAALPSRKALEQFAAQSGYQLNLEPIYSVYSKYRFTWFDVFALLLLLLPPFAGFIGLALWIVHLRRGQDDSVKPLLSVQG
ncbi:MAG TPA: hypothetical protein VFQ00_10035 [Terriglobales bacterium]|nr:hypothetical protein [Terriglobales bacterium]